MRVTLVDTMGSDLTVVNAARVSFHKESTLEPDGSLKEKDKRLIKFLVKHKHMTPFGHCFATFQVKAPVFVARQLMRHKFLRINEVSRRYVDSEPEFFDPRSWRERPEGNIKQGSGRPVFGQTTCDYLHEKVQKEALKSYKDLLALGVAPEQARMVLPQSLYTEWWWSGSLDAWHSMVQMRTKEDAQEETREIAKEISRKLGERFPVSWEALMEAG